MFWEMRFFEGFYRFGFCGVNFLIIFINLNFKVNYFRGKNNLSNASKIDKSTKIIPSPTWGPTDDFNNEQKRDQGMEFNVLW